MTIDYLGSLTLGECVPAALATTTALTGSVTVTATELEARLEGTVDAQAKLLLDPPSLSANLAAAQDLVTNLQAALDLGLPDASLDVTAMADFITSIEEQLSEITATLAAAATFVATLGTPGIHAYRYDGGASSIGTELAGVTASGLPGGAPTDDAHGVILVGTSAGAKAALDALFAT